MYRQFYQLKRAPFHATPDPEFLFLSAGHREALASLTYGIEKRKGFIALIGEDGLGKTTVLRCYLEGSDRARFKPVYIFNADVRFAGLLKTIHRELGLDVDSTDAFELVGALHEELIEKYRQGQNVVLIIDEAQNMPTETLENLRVLSNLETSTDKLLQIVLVGRPELQKRLSQTQLRQLNQRLAVRCSLAPLGPEESLAYIEHRLSRVAMGTESVFTPDALKTVVKHAGGVPRLINILCDNALIAGYAGQHRPVTAKLVKGVIAELTGARKGRLLRWGLAAFGLIGLTTAWYAVPAFQRWVDNGARNWGEPRETTFSDVRSGAASVS
jgi:general secretion pathway protein A